MTPKPNPGSGYRGKQTSVPPATVSHTTGLESQGSESPRFTALLTVCCLITFFSYFAASMRMPVVPLYARDLGVTTTQIGVINSVFYLVAALLSMPAGMLSDRFGRKRVAVAGSIVLCAGVLLLSFAHSYWQLTALYLLLGVGTAAFGPTTMSWVAEISPPTHLGRAYGFYTTALFAGIGIGPAVGGAIGSAMGFTTVFWVAAVLLALTTWPIQRFFPAGDRRPTGAAHFGRPAAPHAPVLANRPLVGCWAATFGACIQAGLFFSFLPLHGDHQGLDVAQIGVVFFAQAAANALSRIPFGALSDRVGRRSRQTLVGMVLVTISMALLSAATGFAHFILAVMGLGVSMAVTFTAIGALIAESVAPHARGLAMGGYNTAIYLGMMAGAVGFGPVMATLGFASGFWLAGLLNLPFIAAFAWSMRRRPEPAAMRPLSTP